MIFDDFKNINLYNLDFEIVSFILNLDPEIKPGRYEICDFAYVNIEEYETKETTKLEAHKKYIDIQFLLKGKERVYTTNLEGLQTLGEYNEEKDIAFFETPKKPLNVSYLTEGKFLVLYPEDAHGPCVQFEDGIKTAVKKAVVKIKIEN